MRCWSFTSCGSGIDARCIDRSANIGGISSEVRPRAGPAADPLRLFFRRRLWTRGVQAVHPRGVQEGVQTCGLVRGSRGACNPMVAPCRLLPATNEEGPGIFPGSFFIGRRQGRLAAGLPSAMRRRAVRRNPDDVTVPGGAIHPGCMTATVTYRRRRPNHSACHLWSSPFWR